MYMCCESTVLRADHPGMRASELALKMRRSLPVGEGRDGGFVAEESKE